MPSTELFKEVEKSVSLKNLARLSILVAWKDESSSTKTSVMCAFQRRSTQAYPCFLSQTKQQIYSFQFLLLISGHAVQVLQVWFDKNANYGFIHHANQHDL